jgi:hypothetical protein
MSARVPTHLINQAGLGGAAAPQCRRTTSPAELAAAVLRRISAEATGPVRGGRPDPLARAWRGRAADEALLLIELCRWLEGCHRHGGRVRPAPVALVDGFVGLARRRAPLPPVRGFVRGVVRQAHLELAGAHGRPDTDLARRDVDTVIELLEQCYREPSGERQGASGPRPVDAALAERLLAGRQPVPAPEVAPEYLVVVLAEPAAALDRLPGAALPAIREGHLHLLVPIGRPDDRSGAWARISRWLGDNGGLRGAGSFATHPGEVPQAAASARRLLALAASPARPAAPPTDAGPADAAPMGGPA